MNAKEIAGNLALRAARTAAMYELTPAVQIRMACDEFDALRTAAGEGCPAAAKKIKVEKGADHVSMPVADVLELIAVVQGGAPLAAAPKGRKAK